MRKIKVTGKFKKGYKIAQKRGMNMSLLDDVILKLRQGEELDEKYKDHPLKGKFKDVRECHILPDWLLMYIIADDILTLTLVATGSHADLFNM